MEIGLPVARHIQTPRGRSWGDPLCDAGNLPASGLGKLPDRAEDYLTGTGGEQTLARTFQFHGNETRAQG